MSILSKRLAVGISQELGAERRGELNLILVLKSKISTQEDILLGLTEVTTDSTDQRSGPNAKANPISLTSPDRYGPLFLAVGSVQTIWSWFGL